MLLAFNKIDWVKFNEGILSTPFSPYCYRNVSCLLYQWYDWIKETIERLVPRVTKHRASLKPCISKETSHKIKKLKFSEKKNCKKSEPTPRNQKFEKEIKLSADSD